MGTRFITLFAIFVLSIALLFFYRSDIDLAVSGYFYDFIFGFYLKSNPVVSLINSSVVVLAQLLLVGCIVALVLRFIAVRSMHPRHYIPILYVIFVYAIGPGLVVNLVFKENFGRARPMHVEQFGGEHKFTPAFVISNQCNHNCSFVSGHASIGFMVFAFGFLQKGRKRMVYNLLALFLGFGFGLARIAKGAHFLSDVVFSGVAVYAVAYILALIMLSEKTPPNSRPVRTGLLEKRR
ncbi:phosphatase PAP2 family protein [Rickettsiales endosymbiont of Peranema trichophorum]|uniref:phosphatase PAP2 family protein n=1 Tax=Rickettsiales endosymbiont of Peranema trichophorum TaxID=2486577 RepID=UPI001023E313|nr:phosphatase PAP2 family protein [Rickettsiales endosymbiont of Peranema trichophorum]RZI47585.1 phosphatase PAP2 family protein [Rickettsiales endosymbiont of Peranema trichophorum]